MQPKAEPSRKGQPRAQEKGRLKLLEMHGAEVSQERPHSLSLFSPLIQFILLFFRINFRHPWEPGGGFLYLPPTTWPQPGLC